jgi:L-phenylalanine/L-methionine N-acetyltransferase
VGALARDRELRLRDGRAVRVRTARPRDAKELTRLLDAVAAEPDSGLLLTPGEMRPRDWKHRLADCLGDPRCLMIVAELDGVLAGNLGLRTDAHPSSHHVLWVGMSVAREARSLGVGGALLETASAWAAESGAERLVLGVFPENLRAIAFYERHGFVHEGVRRDHYRRGAEYHDEVLMARSLTTPLHGRPVTP